MSMWWAWGSPPVVEDAADGDLAALADIHAASFDHPWSEDELARMLAQDNTFALVLRRSNAFGTRRPLGFVMIRTVAGEAEILTIAISPGQRGKGYARKLLQAATFRLYGERCQSLFLEVDAANEPALRLYRSLGFEKVGERKGYYRSAQGDGTALVMKAVLR